MRVGGESGKKSENAWERSYELTLLEEDAEAVDALPLLGEGDGVGLLLVKGLGELGGDVLDHVEDDLVVALAAPAPSPASPAPRLHALERGHELAGLLELEGDGGVLVEAKDVRGLVEGQALDVLADVGEGLGLGRKVDA